MVILSLFKKPKMVTSKVSSPRKTIEMASKFLKENAHDADLGRIAT
jgi:hypothetical protein